MGSDGMNQEWDNYGLTEPLPENLEEPFAHMRRTGHETMATDRKGKTGDRELVWVCWVCRVILEVKPAGDTVH